ncbi:mucin-17 isoform X2 [Hetaerina americana]|uniref:mucin-17 isoform X2 n=1 Tax=Hetaerina americana TaxID=62018 RepID=UPI003A7F281F
MQDASDPFEILFIIRETSCSSTLIALAEETTRPAFESIESVVRAFGSVSFMLESTLGALHASFRAALGVADHLSHLRNILSALSIFRLLQWCSRQLRRLLGQRHLDGSFNGVWGEAANLGDKVVVSSGPSSGPSQWPLRIFIGIVISVSYLAWKLLSYIVGTGGPGSKGEESEAWVQGKEHGCQLAIGSYNFTATMDQELSFSAGDKLIIAPKNRQRANSKDWLLAALMPSTQQTGQNPLPPIKVGLIPANYVRVVERRLRQTPSNAPDAPAPQSSQPNPSPPTCQPNPAPSSGSQMSNTPATTTNPMTTATTSTPPLNTGNTAPAPFIFNAIPLEMQGIQPFVNRGPVAVNNHPVDMQLIPVFHNPRCMAASGPLAVNSHPVGMQGMPFLHNPGCMAAGPLAVNSHPVGMQGIPTLLSGAPASAGNSAQATAQAKKSKPRESGSDLMAAAGPLAVNSHPVGMQGAPTPLSSAPASTGKNAPATAQTKKSKPKESGSDSKPADGGQGV